MLDRCNNQIAVCIREFWKDTSVPESKILTAIDEFLSIYLYVITQARVQHLEAHLLLIETFLNDFTLYTAKVGQTFCTVQQACGFLKQMDQEVLTKSAQTVVEFCKQRISVSVHIIETSFTKSRASSHTHASANSTQLALNTHDILAQSANFGS